MAQFRIKKRECEIQVAAHDACFLAGQGSLSSDSQNLYITCMFDCEVIRFRWLCGCCKSPSGRNPTSKCGLSRLLATDASTGGVGPYTDDLQGFLAAHRLKRRYPARRT